MIASMEKKQPDESNKNKIKDFRSKVELELTAICEDILAILDAKLLPAASAVDAKVKNQKLPSPPVDSSTRRHSLRTSLTTC